MPTMYASAACCSASIAAPWNRRSSLIPCAMYLINRQKGRFLISSSVLFWYLRISRRAITPRLWLFGTLTGHDTTAFFAAANGAFPCPSLLAVFFVRAIVMEMVVLCWPSIYCTCEVTACCCWMFHHVDSEMSPAGRCAIGRQARQCPPGLLWFYKAKFKNDRRQPGASGITRTRTHTPTAALRARSFRSSVDVKRWWYPLAV